MKPTLTPQESATLIAKGISADKASMFAWQKVCGYKGNPLSKKDKNREYNHGITLKKGMMKCGLEYIEYEPLFTLADLLSLLPKEVKRDSLDRPYVLHIIREEDRTIAAYRRDWDSITGADKRTSEFIDSLYELLLWAIDNNHVKLD